MVQAAQASAMSVASIAAVVAAGSLETITPSGRAVRGSHLGSVWRDDPDGRRTVIHALDDCGTANSALFDDGPDTFFLDDPFRYQALVMMQDAATQRRLVALPRSDLPAQMHETRCNVVA